MALDLSDIETLQMSAHKMDRASVQCLYATEENKFLFVNQLFRQMKLRERQVLLL